MVISYKGRFVFSQPLRLLVALSGFVVAAFGTAPGGAVKLGIHTSTANILVFLWPPYGIGQAIIFLSCGLFHSFFFSSRLISAAADWMSTILPQCGLSVNLECWSEMCCTRLAGNTGRKNDAKIAVPAPLHNFIGLYLRN